MFVYILPSSRTKKTCSDFRYKQSVRDLFKFSLRTSGTCWDWMILINADVHFFPPNSTNSCGNAVTLGMYLDGAVMKVDSIHHSFSCSVI